MTGTGAVGWLAALYRQPLKKTNKKKKKKIKKSIECDDNPLKSQFFTAFFYFAFLFSIFIAQLNDRVGVGVCNRIWWQFPFNQIMKLIELLKLSRRGNEKTKNAKKYIQVFVVFLCNFWQQIKHVFFSFFFFFFISIFILIEYFWNNLNFL